MVGQTARPRAARNVQQVDVVLNLGQR